MIDTSGTLKYKQIAEGEWMVVFTLSGMKSREECDRVNKILYDSLVDAGGEIEKVMLE